MSLSHFFSITQTWRIAISWLDTPGRILSSTWYHQWLQLVTPMRQNAQKRSRKFCRSKEDKNGETHPVWAEKGETGCVLGAGESSSGGRRMKLGEEIRSPNQSEHYNHATSAKRKPAETQSFRRFCGRGRRTWSPLPLRSARSLRATGTHSPLGTRFWSGCGNKPPGAG